MHIGLQIGLLVLLAARVDPLPEISAPRQNPGQQPNSTQQSKPPQQQTDSRQGDGQRSKIKRLILKDGSYELISKYGLKGDRVRYLSSERHEWEEMPNSLVDWPATEKYAKEAASENQSRLRQFEIGRAHV